MFDVVGGNNIGERAYIIGKGPCTVFDVVGGNNIGGRAYIIGKGPCTMIDVVGGNNIGGRAYIIGKGLGSLEGYHRCGLPYRHGKRFGWVSERRQRGGSG